MDTLCALFTGCPFIRVRRKWRLNQIRQWKRNLTMNFWPVLKVFKSWKKSYSAQPHSNVTSVWESSPLISCDLISTRAALFSTEGVWISEAVCSCICCSRVRAYSHTRRLARTLYTPRASCWVKGVSHAGWQLFQRLDWANRNPSKIKHVTKNGSDV